MKRSYMVLAILALTILAAGVAGAATVQVNSLYPYNDSAPPAGAWLQAFKLEGSGLDVGTMSRLFLDRVLPDAGNPSPFGSSQAYFNTWDYSSANGVRPPSIWLGTKAYNGLYLSDITKLSYMGFMKLQGATNSDDPMYPYQPVTLRLRVSVDNGANFRYLMVRPWGDGGYGSPGPDKTGSRCGVWEEYDCMSSGIKWYEAWSKVMFNNWDAVLDAYPDAKLTDNLVAGEAFITTTATGCPLNFVLGAENANMDYLGVGWREARWARGAVDKFTIRFSTDTEDTVYDFRSTFASRCRPVTTDPANKLIPDYMQYYGMNNRDVKSRPVQGMACYQQPWDTIPSWCPEGATGNYNNSLAYWNSAGEVIYGRVVADGYVDSEEFNIDDGSGKLIPVRAPGGAAYQSDYVRVKGTMSVPHWHWVEPGSETGTPHWNPATFYSYGGLETITE